MIRRIAIFVLFSIVLWPRAAGAAEPELTPGDVRPGACTPEVVAPFTTVDCRFPLADAGFRVSPDGVLADLDLPYDEQNGTRVSCFIEGLELVCPSVGTFFPTGRRTVSLDFGGVSTGTLASFDVADREDLPVSFTGARREALAFPGRPFSMWVDGGVPGEIWALVRERSTGRAVGVFSVGEPDPDTGLHHVDVSSLLPGRYRVDPCLGASAVGCRRVVGGAEVQVGTGALVPLYPGSAREDADRFNVVIAGSGFEDVEQTRAMALDLLGTDGPVPLLGERRAEAGEQPWSLVFGPLAVEPLRSARHRFNLWLLEDVVADHHALFHDSGGSGSVFVDTAGFDLPLVHVTTLHLNRPGPLLRSEAGSTSLRGDGPPDLDVVDLGFGGAYVAIDPQNHWASAPVVTHEWGHALFDLRDEYSEAGRGVVHGYPNCAADLETANVWWSDLEGAVDPFLATFVEQHRSVGLEPPWGATDDVVVGFIDEDGCYSVEFGQAIRPTRDSVMRSNLPVFGAVNRRQVEEILSLVSGRSPLGPGDVVLVCDPSAGASVVCSGSVRGWVEAAKTSVISAGASAACAMADTDGGLGLVRCEPLPITGSGPWPVALTAAAGVISETVVTPTTTTTTTTTTLPATTTTTTAATTTSTATTLPTAAPSSSIPPGAAEAADGMSRTLVVVGLTVAVLVGAIGWRSWRP